MSQNWDRNDLEGIPSSYSRMVQVVHCLRTGHLVQGLPLLPLLQVHQESQGDQEDPEYSVCVCVCVWGGGGGGGGGGGVGRWNGGLKYTAEISKQRN